MFDLNGNVLGIVSHIVSVQAASEGLALSSPRTWRAGSCRRAFGLARTGRYLISNELAHAFNLPTAGLLCNAWRTATGRTDGLRGGRYSITLDNEQLLIGGDVIVAVEGIELAEPDAYERVRRRLLDVRASGGVMRLS